MSFCTHNDHPGMEPCKNEAVAPGSYCVEHGCCLCGGVMLADTEDWKVHLCDECYYDIQEYVDPGYNTATTHHIDNKHVERIVLAAYEVGRKSVIGSPLEPDEVVEKER